VNKINIKGFFEYVAADKKRIAAFIMLICGIVVILLAADLGQNEENYAAPGDLGGYEESLGRELEELCSSIEGAGRCYVKVTFERGESYEYKGSTVIGSEPPRVLGVCVICEGGDSSSVRAAISESMCALFDIGSNRVAVLKMK
jgi:hypothetical protein